MWRTVAAAADAARHPSTIDAAAQYFSATRTALHNLEALFEDRLESALRLDIKDAFLLASENLRASPPGQVGTTQIKAAVAHLDQINAQVAEEVGRLVGDDVDTFRQTFGRRIARRFFQRPPSDFFAALGELRTFDFRTVSHRPTLIALWQSSLSTVLARYAERGGTRLLDRYRGWLTGRARGIEILWILIVLVFVSALVSLIAVLTG